VEWVWEATALTCKPALFCAEGLILALLRPLLLVDAIKGLCFGKVGGSVWESNPPYLYGVPLDLKSRQATRPDPLPERMANSTLV